MEDNSNAQGDHSQQRDTKKKKKSIYEMLLPQTKKSNSKPIVKSQHPKKSPATHTIKDPTPIYEDQEIKEMLAKIDEYRTNIEKITDEAYQKLGKNFNEILTYLNNPNNFPSKVWQELQRERNERQNKVNKMIGKESKGKAIKKPQDAGQKRKSKMIGARKRWLPMR